MKKVPLLPGGSLLINISRFHQSPHVVEVVEPYGIDRICLFYLTDYNFSHRIDHFSFGEPVNGVINPLDGEENVTPDSKLSFLYIVQLSSNRTICYKVQKLIAVDKFYDRHKRIK